MKKEGKEESRDMFAKEVNDRCSIVVWQRGSYIAFDVAGVFMMQF